MENTRGEFVLVLGVFYELMMVENFSYNDWGKVVLYPFTSQTSMVAPELSDRL